MALLSGEHRAPSPVQRCTWVSRPSASTPASDGVPRAGSREAHAWALELARTARRGRRPVCVWVALPCTAWSTWQRLAKDPAALARKRLQSVALLRRTVTLIKDLRKLDVDAYFEWPRFCDGWSPVLCPPTAELLRVLPARAAVDGCALGVVSRAGFPLRKAWRIQCSRPDAPAALQVRCPGDHRHGRIEGAETTGTGFYTKEAANHFFKGIFNTGIDSPGNIVSGSDHYRGT